MRMFYIQYKCSYLQIKNNGEIKNLHIGNSGEYAVQCTRYRIGKFFRFNRTHYIGRVLFGCGRYFMCEKNDEAWGRLELQIISISVFDSRFGQIVYAACV